MFSSLHLLYRSNSPFFWLLSGFLTCLQAQMGRCPCPSLQAGRASNLLPGSLDQNPLSCLALVARISAWLAVMAVRVKLCFGVCWVFKYRPWFGWFVVNRLSYRDLAKFPICLHHHLLLLWISASHAHRGSNRHCENCRVSGLIHELCGPAPCY